MRRIVYIGIIFGLFACSSLDTPQELTTDMVNNPNSASEETAPVAMASMSFEEDSYDFGEISQGEKVEHNFTFTNNGEADLIISSAVGSCGCTVPSYPKEPISPGETGEIKVIFDSNGKKGAQHKREPL